MSADIHLTCCTAPQTTVILVLRDEPHDQDLVRRCRCGQWWLDRMHERINWHGGEDDLYTWLLPLDDTEAAAIQAAVAAGQRPDLGFLRTRPGLLIDSDQRVCAVPGLP